MPPVNGGDDDRVMGTSCDEGWPNTFVMHSANPSPARSASRLPIASPASAHLAASVQKFITPIASAHRCRD